MTTEKPTWEEWKAEFIRYCLSGGWTQEEIDNAWPWDTLKETWYDDEWYHSPQEALYEEIQAGL